MKKSHSNTSSNRVFVFLEIFGQEGGIQCYVKDILAAYHSLQEKGEFFLLRDVPECNNPFENGFMRFHYLKTLPPWRGRLKLAFSLLICLLQRRPHHVFCGHIKLASLIFCLCKPLGIPYTISTHGKEVEGGQG